MKFRVIRYNEFEDVEADTFTISGGALVLIKVEISPEHIHETPIRAYAPGTWVRIDPAT